MDENLRRHAVDNYTNYNQQAFVLLKNKANAFLLSIGKKTPTKSSSKWIFTRFNKVYIKKICIFTVKPAFKPIKTTCYEDF